MALIKLSYSITFKTPYHLSTWSRPWCDIQCGRHTSYSDSRDCQFSGGKSSLRYSYGFVLISEVGTGPLICSGSEHDIINRLIMIFRVVIRRKSNNDRSSRNNNCKKVGNVIKPWMLSTQESFQENPHILDRFLNLLPNTAYTHIPQNTRRIETSIKIRKHP